MGHEFQTSLIYCVVKFDELFFKFILTQRRIDKMGHLKSFCRISLDFFNVCTVVHIQFLAYNTNSLILEFHLHGVNEQIIDAAERASHDLLFPRSKCLHCVFLKL